jgi:hypothetical protein
MQAARTTLVNGSHLAASTRGAVSMLQISSERRVWSMKWLSIFAAGALGRFSRCQRRQTVSSRDEFNTGEPPA